MILAFIPQLTVQVAAISYELAAMIGAEVKPFVNTHATT